jgi:hypothetical protein
MTREWRDWQAEKEQITAIEAEEKRLAIRPKTRKALTWARLYGGAALILGFGDCRSVPAGPEGREGRAAVRPRRDPLSGHHPGDRHRPDVRLLRPAGAV